MDCRPLPFRQLPHQPKLFLEYQDHFEKVKSFYFHAPNMPAVTRAARKLGYPHKREAEISSILRKQKIGFGGGGGTFSNFRKLQKGAASVVFGQEKLAFFRAA